MLVHAKTEERSGRDCQNEYRTERQEKESDQVVTDDLASSEHFHLFRFRKGSFSCVVKKALTDRGVEKLVCEREIYMTLGPHPNLVTLLEGWTTHLFLEPMEADLYQVVEGVQNGLPHDQCLFIFREMVSGLKHMHERGIAHHDVKLENTLLGKGRRVKLCDMDHARFYEKGEVCPFVDLGTTRYKAPETFVMAHDPFSADVWSVGVCLFSMAHNRMPFRQANAYCNVYASVVHEKEIATLLCSRLGLENKFPSLDSILCIDPSRRPKMHEIV